jgi:hypothetical protein
MFEEDALGLWDGKFLDLLYLLFRVYIWCWRMFVQQFCLQYIDAETFHLSITTNTCVCICFQRISFLLIHELERLERRSEN